MDLRRSLIVAAAVVTTFGVASASADAAITISRAELSGTQLRVEGSGAVPNHAVTVSPGSVAGTSDASGAFKIQKDPYGSSTCQITVSDGLELGVRQAVRLHRVITAAAAVVPGRDADAIVADLRRAGPRDYERAAVDQRRQHRQRVAVHQQRTGQGC